MCSAWLDGSVNSHLANAGDSRSTAGWPSACAGSVVVGAEWVQAASAERFEIGGNQSR